MYLPKKFIKFSVPAKMTQKNDVDSSVKEHHIYY